MAKMQRVSRGTAHWAHTYSDNQVRIAEKKYWSQLSLYYMAPFLDVIGTEDGGVSECISVAVNSDRNTTLTAFSGHLSFRS